MSHILIVEDNESLSRMYNKVLKHAGYQTLTTSTVVEAISLLDAYQPPIVCLDWRLEDGTADAFLDHVRGGEGDYNPSIIIISAEVTRDDIADYQDMIVSYHNKPIALREMVAYIQDLG